VIKLDEEIGKGQGFCFSLRHRLQTVFGFHLASFTVDSGKFSTGLKQSLLEADHLPPSRAEVKNAWSYTSTTLRVFVA